MMIKEILLFIIKFLSINPGLTIIAYMSIYHLPGVAKFESTGIFGIDYHRNEIVHDHEPGTRKNRYPLLHPGFDGYLYTSCFVAGRPDGRHI